MVEHLAQQAEAHARCRMAGDVVDLAAEDLRVELREAAGQFDSPAAVRLMVERRDVPVEEASIFVVERRQFAAELLQSLLRGASREGEMRFPAPRVAADRDLRAVEQHVERHPCAARRAVVRVEVDDAPTAARRGQFAFEAEASVGDPRTVNRLVAAAVHGVENHALPLPHFGHLALKRESALATAGRDERRGGQQQKGLLQNRFFHGSHGLGPYFNISR